MLPTTGVISPHCPVSIYRRPISYRAGVAMITNLRHITLRMTHPTENNLYEIAADGQTDGQTESPPICLASHPGRDKNAPINFIFDVATDLL